MARRTRAAKRTKLELRGKMWDLHHAVARMPRPQSTTLSKRLRLVEEELAVKDVLARYSYFYDGGDLDGVMSVFHTNCTLINPRGTYIGVAAVRKNYAYLISLTKVVLHLAPNVTVRLSDDCKSAWMTAYYYSVAVGRDKKLFGVGGTYADRLVKEMGRWTIIERRISFNFRHALTPDRSVGPPPPTPSENKSSRDYAGPEAEM